MTADVVLHAAGWRDALPDYESVAGAAFNVCAERFKNVWRLPECCVCFSDDAELQELNAKFRGKNAPTNVLSFPALERSPAAPTAPAEGFMGDVIIALETTKREAEESGLTLRDHTMHLLIHGVLHLLGYDHETDEDAAIMEPLETSLLAGLNIADPYADS